MYRALPILLLTLCISMLLFPDITLDSGKEGLWLWGNLVFPALFPFFVTSELLITYGFVEKIGKYIHKPAQSLFRLPGEAGYVIMMGLFCGYPAGAKWTADLRKRNFLTKNEAERLLAFSNGPSPLFLLGVVAGGYFSSVSIGWVLLGCLYASTLLLGLFLRSGGVRSSPGRVPERTASPGAVGQELNRAIRHSVDTLLLIGGIIIYFSVITGMISHLTSGLNFDIALLTSLFEITVGVEMITSLGQPVLTQLCLLTFLTGFHGFSVQFQVISMLQGTDINPGLYVKTRIFQGLMNVILLLIILHFYDIPAISTTVSGFYAYAPDPATIFILALYLILTVKRMISHKKKRGCV